MDTELHMLTDILLLLPRKEESSPVDPVPP